MPDFAATLRDCGLFTSTVNRFVAGARRLRVIPESLKKAWRESRCISIKVLDTLDITRPGDYEKIEYLKAMELAADGISALGHRYAAEARKLAEAEPDEKRRKNCYRLQGPAIRFRKNRRVPSARRFSRCIFTRPVFSWSRMQQATTRDVWISIFTHFIRQISRLAV